MKQNKTEANRERAKQHKYQRAFLRVRTRPAKNTQQANKKILTKNELHTHKRSYPQNILFSPLTHPKKLVIRKYKKRDASKNTHTSKVSKKQD